MYTSALAFRSASNLSKHIFLSDTIAIRLKWISSELYLVQSLYSVIMQHYFNYLIFYKCNLVFFTVFSNSKNIPCSRTVDQSIVSTVSLVCSDSN